jgi:Spy/CpxP family protein refolding chaperone
MKLRLIVAMCIVSLAALTYVRAEEKAADAKPEKKPAAAKVVQPWSKLTTLSEEQKTQIKEIRAKANAEVKVIRDKEQADIMALLSDAQKNELKAIMEADAAAKKKTAAKETEGADTAAAKQ